MSCIMYLNAIDQKGRATFFCTNLASEMLWRSIDEHVFSCKSIEKDRDILNLDWR